MVDEWIVLYRGEKMEIHKDDDQYNRLKLEKSPYLIQHARNPVGWYPWSDEAFLAAQRKNIPIFLSIGYSTCHWCHVMAHECFEDEEIADDMNRAFISIKVDREERPDIDSTYMTVCQMMTGSGGWPLSIIMTPEKKPFFAATYIPKESSFGRIGMRELIPMIERLWREEPGRIERITEEVEKALQKYSLTHKGEANVDEDLLEKAFKVLSSSFDEEKGGFSGAPKFPTPSHLLFLMRYWKRKGEVRALEMVEKTLSSMRHGGIYDQLGFGFHRYSTDAEWLVPHFEKMLYDQAFLMLAYSEAYQITAREEYRRTALEILRYVERSLTAPEGGFFSAEDADSEGEEGRFYLWTHSEIETVLDQEEIAICQKIFGIEPDGNFVDEVHRMKNGRNILYLRIPFDEYARSMRRTEGEVSKTLDRILTKLYSARDERIHPHLDDKVLTDWNGLMVAALARAAQIFGESAFLSAAERACAFLLQKMRGKGGELLHRYREGESAITGFLSDYTFLIWGLLELYEATFDEQYLETAFQLNEHLFNHFWDKENGGYFMTSHDGEKVLIRTKELYDGALPSGNSVALLNLLRMHFLTGRQELRERADKLIEAFAPQVARDPAAYTSFLCSVDFNIGPGAQIVIVGERGREDSEEMLRALRRSYLPNKVLIFKSIHGDQVLLQRIVPFIKEHKPVDGKATCYICSNFSCAQPTTNSIRMLETLKEIGI